MNEELLDKPRRVREGEELDAEALGGFLKENIEGLSGDVAIRQFPSGFSNWTYLVTVGDRELILRRPPAGTKAATAHDMGREARIQTALKPVFPYVPDVLLHHEADDVIGAPFYVMDRIKGIILRSDLPEGMTLSEDEARTLCENMIDVWVELHSVDYVAAGLGEMGHPEGYVRRQVEGWSKRYRNARTDDAPDFESVMGWLAENMPPDSDTPTIIHNDYKFDNVVLDPDDPLKIVGVLDWELATIGDPLMDLGSSLAYWVQAGDPDEAQFIRRLPTHLPGMMTREQIIARYAEKTGRNVDNWDFYFTFGLFRLAVIAQQIYYRFYHGQTKDPRFGALVFAVQILEKSAAGVISRE
ncbi:MAG: phosphotransferase family protein [Deltaproteobacteria bacterium]|nr:phosphotransferase family protein [Deltaproteobacteria bacterium]MCB9489202.1 phosphotransferase family protein [Deltaproteobacteria bacterium]